MAAVLCVATIGLAQTEHRPASIPAPEARIDINHANLNQLMKVPGMTQSWAGRIVRYRPYRTKQDLLDKGIVSSQVYDRIKDYVIAHREPRLPNDMPREQRVWNGSSGLAKMLRPQQSAPTFAALDSFPRHPFQLIASCL